MQIPKCKYLRASGGGVSWKMSSGWVPPVVSAAEECGHVTGHVALSYM